MLAKPCILAHFSATRMQLALWREAFHILDEGIADAKTIDEAVRYSFGMRLPTLGPMENADMIGLDLVFDIQQYVFGYLANNRAPSAILENAVKAGILASRAVVLDSSTGRTNRWQTLGRA